MICQAFSHANVAFSTSTETVLNLLGTPALGTSSNPLQQECCLRLFQIGIYIYIHIYGTVTLTFTQLLSSDKSGFLILLSETVLNLLWTGNPRRPPRLSHSSCALLDGHDDDDDDELMLNVLRCRLTYWGQVVTNAEARFSKIHIRKVYACLAVTCHLHFWQNDRDFLRATVVTRGWNGYRNKSQHRKSTLEKKILPPFQQGFEPATFQSRVRCSNH